MNHIHSLLTFLFQFLILWTPFKRADLDVEGNQASRDTTEAKRLPFWKYLWKKFDIDESRIVEEMTEAVKKKENRTTKKNIPEDICIVDPLKIQKV